MYLLFKNLLFSKKIILLQSYLQILNFKELIYSKKISNENLRNTIILSHHIKDSYFKKTQKLLKRLNIKNISIQCSRGYHVKLVYVLLKFRRFFLKKFELVITGNANSYLDREFISLSDKTIILDDGTNIFDNVFQKLKFSNCVVFSVFEPFYFKKYNYLANKYFFLKKNLKNLSGYSKDIYFIGSPVVEIFKLRQSAYIDLLRKTILDLKLKSKIIYVPHPKENPLYLKKYFKGIQILNIDCPIELHLLNKNKFPHRVISFRSTALIILKKISNKFRLLNLSEKKILMPNFDYGRRKKINRYIEKIGIKTKVI